VFLSTDAVGITDEPTELVVQLIDVAKDEGVDVIARRDRLDLAETGMLASLGEHQMAAKIAAARHHGGEGHTNLKGDAGFFRQHQYRSVRFDRGQKRFIEKTCFWRLSLEMILKTCV
jgi:hypothetical protein